MFSLNLTAGGWYDVLPSGQEKVVQSFLDSGLSEDQVAEKWLSQIGPSNTFGFGGGGSIQNFYANVKSEFISFVCGDPKYDEERAQAAEIWNNQGKVGLVSMVSALVASAVNLAAAAIVPVIALLFSLVAKIGLNAFCGACAAKDA